jgi:putative SOS response-associated peptidase YedK
MCGRVRLSSDYSELKIQFRIPDDQLAPNFAPNWNCAPTHRMPIVRLDHGRRLVDLAKWGLVPFWAQDEKIGYSTFNARAEAITTKPAYRDAWKHGRRCIVPVDNFYEWKTLGPKDKQPYAIALPDREIMALAGLWDSWRSPAGETVHSFTIVTTEPNGEMAPIHNRMPVILPPTVWDVWLGEQDVSSEAAAALLVPYAEHLVMWPVPKDVGNVKDNRPDLIEPVAG